jgi:hypothetical protein
MAYKRARDRDGGDGLPLRPETTVFVKPVAAEALEPDLVVEQFTDSQVVAKCGGLCAKCHERVDVGCGGVDDAAFVWMVPLEKSHSATLENRLLVHKRCVG